MTDILQATLLYKTDREVFFLDAEIAFRVSHLEVKTVRKNIESDGEHRPGSAVECLQNIPEAFGSAPSAAPLPASSPRCHDPKEAQAGSQLCT